MKGQNNEELMPDLSGSLSKAAVFTGLMILLMSLIIGAVKLTADIKEVSQPSFNIDAGVSFVRLSLPTPRHKAPAVAEPAYDPTQRRDEFRVQIRKLAHQVSAQYKETVVVDRIYFAIMNTEKRDAAMVVFKSEKMGESTATFFVFINGTWRTFPSDFQ